MILLYHPKQKKSFEQATQRKWNEVRRENIKRIIDEMSKNLAQYPIVWPNSSNNAAQQLNVYTEDIKQLWGPVAGLMPPDPATPPHHPAHPSALLVSAVAAVVIDQVSGTTTNNNVV